MDDLTDLQICKRIAEIECHVVWDGINNFPDKFYICELSPTDGGEYAQEYNPLTNDALRMRLIDKYNVNIKSHPQSPSAKWYSCQSVNNGKVSMCNAEFNNLDGIGDAKAALLAIIEAHKES
jgi:hypothetical protein